jgi:hypothetical protein
LGIKLSIVSFLEFHGISAALFSDAKHLFGCFQTALMIMANFRNNVTATLI